MDSKVAGSKAVEAAAEEVDLAVVDLAAERDVRGETAVQEAAGSVE